ncbi:MAG: DUF721 domain-containing protein [Robiginitomaculum sp.]|nr:DUF721 domain-containing protein [Robiginitomaculum sp.]
MSDQGKSQSKETALKRAAAAYAVRYLENNRGKRQYRHAPSAGWATGKVLKPLAKKFGPSKNTLQNHWPEIIGAKWATLSKPMALRNSKDGKTLVIEAKGPACALIQADTGRILAKINQFLGSGHVNKIIVKQGRMTALPAKTSPDIPSPNEQLHSELENSPQNSLQSALNALGRKVKAKT